MFPSNRLGRPWRGEPMRDVDEAVPSGELRVGEIIGYRYWYADPSVRRYPLLRSLALYSPWWPHRPIRARLPHKQSGYYQVAPEHYSRPGLHAWNGIGASLWEGLPNLADFACFSGCGLAFGRVRLWGTVIECDWGYRAEYGQVEEILWAWRALRPWDAPHCVVGKHPDETPATVSLLLDLRRAYQ